ncbi:MAG: DegT/DnrJ/EryC1/StrS family aminotransferase [Candidatus Improbicoccus devescovinae]|nr:MAG: DegT/DnrJ/EryC1/StrS family aminotransferase [Candidatus Improbicoccus devescovinae]
MRNIKFSPPDITETEISYITEVLKSNWITTGTKTKEFETKLSAFCTTNNTKCMSSATACLEMTLRLLGIGPGDEVITTPYTYSATCSVIYHVGARPIMVDLAPDSYEMDYNLLDSVINSNTKAIIPVDIGGILCNYTKIINILESHKHIFSFSNNIQKNIGRIAIIADSAHSLGSKYKNIASGSWADFTVFSFHAVKNLTTAEGGAVTWNPKLNLNDNEIYDYLSLLSLHGQNKNALQKSIVGNWEYDIILLGYKCNMTDIHAAIGLAQFERFGALLQKRKKIVEIYNQILHNSQVKIYQDSGKSGDSSNHLYILNLVSKTEDCRNEIILKMAEIGITTNVHYKPLPMFTAYKKKGFDINFFPNSYKMYANEITLPLHTSMSCDDAEYVAVNFKKILEKNKN